MNADVVEPTAAPDYRLPCRLCATFKTHEMQQLLKHQEQDCPASPAAAMRTARKVATGKRRR